MAANIPSDPGRAAHSTSSVVPSALVIGYRNFQLSPSSQSGVPAVIPPSHPSRTLVLCFDGFGNEFDKAGAYNSNVWKFFSLLKKDDKHQQMCYYHSGLGTYAARGGSSPYLAKIDVALDEIVGWNLEAHVQDGYKFLMKNYQEGDRICLFGFSRGAYTARALAGMLDKVGLLPAGNDLQVPFAFKIYARDDGVGLMQGAKFKAAFSSDVCVDFIGVWETVSFVGLIHHPSLPFARSPNAIRVFRQALGLDEHRVGFQPYHYHQAEGAFGGQDAKEVWFIGAHKDVGGGAVPDYTPHSLARIPLRWMIWECFRSGTGIQFYAEAVRHTGIDPTSLYPIVKERELTALKAAPHHLSTIALPPPESSEEEHDMRDALAPIHDPLAGLSLWWILEFIPMRQRVQGPAPAGQGATVEVQRRNLTVNFSRGRDVPKHTPCYAHVSVETRMKA